MIRAGLARFDALLARPVSPRSLAALRIAVGVLAFVHLRPLAAAALEGDTHHGRFHTPYVDALARIPEGAYTTIMVVGAAAAVAMALGAAARVATATTFAVTALHLLISTTHLHNNRAYLVTVLGILAMAPCGRVWSVDAMVEARRAGRSDELVPGWTVWLLRFAYATVYFGSGLSKLVDPDWFGGTVTWGRVTLGEDQLRSSVLPDALVDVIVGRAFHTVAAKAIVATELFIALGLWWRRTRVTAVAVAVVFHVMIEFSADVQLFSWLAISVLVVWIDPDL